MPYLSKEAMSKYLRTDCKRQLRLYLSPDNATYRAERNAQGMPDPQTPRPGLEQIAQAGEEWQADKLHDLTTTFGKGAVVGDAHTTASGVIRFRAMPLSIALSTAVPGHFLVEAQYEVGPTFEASLGIAHYRTQLNLKYAAVRPDIIEVVPPGSFRACITPDGEVRQLPVGDTRVQLRVIDIKLTAEPSPNYFAEVAYYSMVLAGWIVDQGLDGQYVVVPEGAIWPGTHEAARLTVMCNELQSQGVAPTVQQLRAALQEDLEPVPFDVFAYRIRRFLHDDIPDVLSQAWTTLPYHVDNRCAGCKYLGYPWVNAQGQPTSKPDHCMPLAKQQDHLSRVAFISRGASAALQDGGVKDVASLSQRPHSDPIFDSHQVLRATRTVVAGRATSLNTQLPVIPPASGTSAIMPRWTDLHIYLSADFDVSSAITSAFGLKAFWYEPRSFGSLNPTTRGTNNWRDVYIVEKKDLLVERRELLVFLKRIDEILTWARNQSTDTTVQFYLWDSLQYDHLTRVIGRHLEAILKNQAIQHLAWLFPPEEVLSNPAMVTRRSPITIVRDVVRAVLAAPIPHYYSLLETARIYYHASLPPNIAKFSIHPLFEDQLSDQIPSERIHEIWSRITARRHWQQQWQTLNETVEKRLTALETVTRRLEVDLGNTLGQSAPRITAGPPAYQTGVSSDGQLWYTFAKLNAALAELEVHKIRAMPPHEREARFHSARLARRVSGAQEQSILNHFGLQPQVGRRVYQMRNTSREVKLRDGDFSFAVAPESDAGFLDRRIESFVQGYMQPPRWVKFPSLMEEATNVTVAGVDRDQGYVVLDASRRWPTVLDDLEAHGLADFNADVVLDPVHHDFFTKKLLASLQAVGNPPGAQTRQRVQMAVGQKNRRGARPSRLSPPADFFWDGLAMHNSAVQRHLGPAEAELRKHGTNLNPTQWDAWRKALSSRLQLIWGPPGTGKSHTLRAIINGAVLEAYQQQRPLRILVSASTYSAMDNVLLDVYQDLGRMLPGSIDLYRIRSSAHPREAYVPLPVDVELDRHQPSATVLALHASLQAPRGITIVGATPEQVYNLLALQNGSAQQEFFDFILIDEASQMDVAHSVLPICSLAYGGSVVLAGDPKQLPPIHQAQPPLELEAMVGSVYTYCKDIHGVSHVMLDENYRSNDTLVSFSLNAGYEPTLSSYSPGLRVNLLASLPTSQPPNWPADLYWTPEWAELLDPNLPATCFVYPEGRSSQSNPFEADAVASLITLLYGRMADKLANERDPSTGAYHQSTNSAYTADEFWRKAVGIVTPHRAQQGLIVGRLQQLFGGTVTSPSLIRDAVDTVERFQGQQRDVIIASFALGDPDAIHTEDEFLMSLNRFNVMASRARAKLVVLVSREVVDHLSDDLDTLRQSSMLKRYVESFCTNPRGILLGRIENGQARTVPGLFKSHL